MTNSGESQQGMVQAGGVCRALRPEAQRWGSMPLYPLECVRVEVVIHQDPTKDVYCLGIEYSDPHTRELLGKVLDPARRRLSRRQVAEQVSVEVEAALSALFDPDPF